MKIHAGKPIGNILLTISFLLFVAIIAVAPIKQVLHVINEIPLGENTLKTYIKNTKGKLDEIYSNMLNFTSPPLVNKRTYIEINGSIARLMGQRRMNNVVKLKNEYLIAEWEGVDGIQPKLDTSPYVSGIKQLKEFCESRGIAFLFVQAPVKSCKYDKQLPMGISDFQNENMDEFLSLVRGLGIEALDLRELLHNDGLDHYQAFFKTDVHWTPETGFWAANKIQSYFVNKGILTNKNTVVQNLSNYNIDVYTDIFVGNQARKTGVAFGGIENISLIYPQFDTNIHLSGNEIDKSGSFKDVMFDMSYMARDFEASPYNVYPLYPNQYIHFNNNAAENKKTILFGSDSFGMVCAPFLSLSVENLFFGYATWSDLIRCLNTANPDIVVILFTSVNTWHLQQLADVFKDQSE
ncbi:hypothetical protein AGMMS50230_18840 [Spirochaetia bacterium]|nr:hypothetical protein AGMMS50230_18840 [Spirochaetia bacterium]